MEAHHEERVRKCRGLRRRASRRSTAPRGAERLGEREDAENAAADAAVARACRAIADVDERTRAAEKKFADFEREHCVKASRMERAAAENARRLEAKLLEQARRTEAEALEKMRDANEKEARISHDLGRRSSRWRVASGGDEGDCGGAGGGSTGGARPPPTRSSWRGRSWQLSRAAEDRADAWRRRRTSASTRHPRGRAVQALTLEHSLERQSATGFERLGSSTPSADRVTDGAVKHELRRNGRSEGYESGAGGAASADGGRRDAGPRVEANSFMLEVGAQDAGHRRGGGQG